VRTGVLLGAFWLALPTRTRDAAWANVSPVAFFLTIGGIIFFAARPKAFLLYVVPALLLLGALSLFLRPRPK